ncbi:MAG: 23S rRNA (adenine(2030)-N(6))-methyltransferase RlmJ [Candidatus Synoicihabitans palmerolidicus]|nr:23S rRNA (adenine(2030)-N(6))-methyltransferase RlmJ [Candidatus Synoicihabitans palmerolidicus]
MNYRHHYHAGNFADVAKHLVLLALVDGMQRKEKGFLYLDTHAGRGAYDLMGAARGDVLARRPEWPDGWGRLTKDGKTGGVLVQRYLAAVSEFAESMGGDGKPYPGSPALVAARLREQDRAVFCERHPEEYGALVTTLLGFRRTRAEERDGYEAMQGNLPPKERRALVLIDPPYEQSDESERVTAALRDGLRRLPGGTFAVWYPITERVGVPAFVRAAEPGHFPPTWKAELTIAGPESGLKMRGAGVMVVNPPWQLDAQVKPVMVWLGEQLQQAPGSGGELHWLVPE